MSAVHPGPTRTARRAAGIAILSLLGAVVVGGAGLLHSGLWRPVLAMLAIAASIVGAWYLLSRRGLARVIGALVVVGGFAAFVLITVTAEYGGLALVAAIALAALSSAAARYALAPSHREPDPVRAVRSGPVHVSAPAVLIMNPKSGGGKVGRFHLAEECRKRGIEPVVLEPGDDLRQLAVEAVARGVAVIGMAGGDGSQALVASVAARNDVPYVCVPAGTRNHLALDLGIDRDDVVGALDAFVSGVERRVDLATVNGLVFVNNASMGLYAKIVQSDAYRDAKVKTAADMLPDLLGPDTKSFDLRFTGPGGVRWPYAHMLLVSNNRYELDHLIGVGKRLRMDSGRLGVAAARIDGPGDAVTFISLETAGRIRRFSGWVEWETPTFVVDSANTVEVGIDGEAMLMEPPLIFQSLPGALRVRVPQGSTQGRYADQPARLAPATISALIAVAAGRG